MATYHAFPYGKANQSFKVEDEENRSIYEANLVKFRLFFACDYEFNNCLTGASVTRKVGKTVSVEEGTMGVSMTTASYFKLDGQNCFEILENMGYHIDILFKPDILHPEYGLFNSNGDQIAVYRTNVLAEREENVFAIGNKQRNMVITTESDDIDAVFLGAFILSRVDFSPSLM